MQKQKIDSIYHLALQSTYDNIEIALFEEDQMLGKKTINKIYASKDLILNIDCLLKENDLDIEDLTFTSVNQGPGPFTTLRVVIVTANALNFNGTLPIIGIDGLDAILKSYEDSNFDTSVAMLNAFNNDIYFAIEHNSCVQKGWKNIEAFLRELKSQFPQQKIRFIGNAIEIYKKDILEKFNDYAYFVDPNPKIGKIEQIAKMAYENWISNSNICEEISPLYLKDALRFKKQEYA